MTFREEMSTNADGGKHLLRDYNAAINIRNQGLAMLA